jgi:heme/copper-type cytochrome/quinol oxidase subunit 3
MYALPAGPIPAPQRQTLVGSAFAAMAMIMLAGGMLAVWIMQRDATLEAGELWVPKGVGVPEVPANVMLIAFLGLCVFGQWAVWSAKRNDRGHTVFALLITILMALLIVNAQAYIYHEMDMGIAEGTYQMMFYAVTGMFMVLMIVGILFSAVTAFRFTGGRTGDREIVAAHAIYWYTTAAVFAALWFVVYVTK